MEAVAAGKGQELWMPGFSIRDWGSEHARTEHRAWGMGHLDAWISDARILDWELGHRATSVGHPAPSVGHLDLGCPDFGLGIRALISPARPHSAPSMGRWPIGQWPIGHGALGMAQHPVAGITLHYTTFLYRNFKY